MKPKKVTVEGELAERQKALCDEILYRAAKMMVEEVGAPMPMVLDRMITYSAAQSCTITGSPETAEIFRDCAAKIDAGLFHRVTGENSKPRKGH